MAERTHLLLVAATFYDDIGGELVRGATAAIETAGATWEMIEVPGAFEIPAAVAFADRSQKEVFDGYVALGCVIRGETSHYDYVCGESARGLQDLALGRDLAIGFGILTVENREQAWARAALDQGNKGSDAAGAALAMIGLKRRFGVA